MKNNIYLWKLIDNYRPNTHQNISDRNNNTSTLGKRCSSTAVEFPQLRQLITIQSITYTKNRVSKIGYLKPPILHPILYVTRQVRQQLSAPYGQPPICSQLDFMLLVAPTRLMRLRLSAPGQPPILQPGWILCSLLLLPTDAAAVVGTLRAAATLLPSWIYAPYCSYPMMRLQLSAPWQPPICSRLDFMLLIAPCPTDAAAVVGTCGQPPICCRVGDKRLGHFLAVSPQNGGCCFFYVVPSAPAIGC